MTFLKTGKTKMVPKNDILTAAQLHILAAFRKKLFSKLTFKDLKELAKTHSHSRLQNALSKFQKLQLTTKESVGDVTSYQLNLANNTTVVYLTLIDQQEIRKNDLLFRLLSQTTGQVEKQTEFFTVLVFGSYAKGQATASSDVDIAIIVENDRTKQNVNPELGIAKRKSLPPADFQVFTRQEFIDMLRIEEENVGKEIARNNFIYYGAESFFKLINKVLNETARQTLFGTR